MHADPEAELEHTPGHEGARWLLPVLCVAAFARVLHLVTVQGDPLHAVPLGDEALYVWRCNNGRQ